MQYLPPGLVLGNGHPVPVKGVNDQVSESCSSIHKLPEEKVSTSHSPLCHINGLADLELHPVHHHHHHQPKAHPMELDQQKQSLMNLDPGYFFLVDAKSLPQWFSQRYHLLPQSYPYCTDLISDCQHHQHQCQLVKEEWRNESLEKQDSFSTVDFEQEYWLDCEDDHRYEDFTTVPWVYEAEEPFSSSMSSSYHVPVPPPKPWMRSAALEQDSLHSLLTNSEALLGIDEISNTELSSDTNFSLYSSCLDNRDWNGILLNEDFKALSTTPSCLESSGVNKPRFGDDLNQGLQNYPSIFVTGMKLPKSNASYPTTADFYHLSSN